MNPFAVVVVGASAGGLEPILRIFGELRPDTPAAWFVVMHIDSHASLMAELLSGRSRIPAREAVEGAAIEPGRIVVAAPDHHLLVGRARVHVSHGPRVNWTRPAIDPLFRSAAEAHGPRVIGAVLSGYLNDGSAGLRAIKAGGGTAVIQDPSDAACPEMPRNALHHAAPDHSVPSSRMASLLSELATRAACSRWPEPLRVQEA